jgi:hypothetical protein
MSQAGQQIQGQHAKEQEEDAAPMTVESETLLKLASPMYFIKRPFGTKAWITPLTK